MSSEELQVALAGLNRARFAPALPTDDGREALATEYGLRLRELAFLEAERAAIALEAAAAPDDATGFVAWFEALRDTGPGQHDALFPWLANHATLDQLRWFLRQEAGGEAGFEDLVALAQLKLPERPKLELARNYWDELGRGAAGGMHGPMLARLERELRLDRGDAICWESLALGNLMAGLASNRRYAYHALGALGVVELTAPGRAALVNAGLRRCGVAPRARQYYALHATLDIKHSAAWDAEVIAPLVAADRALARSLAEGALMRLAAGARCFARYRAQLRIAVARAA